MGGALMPYYPLDFDAKKKIPKVARAAGIEPGDVAWGLFEAWEHVFLTKDDEVSALVLDGCFGPNPKLREALVAYGFIEPTDEGFRMKGSERLLGLSTKPAEAGAVRASGAQRDQRGRFQKSSAPPADAGQPLDSHSSQNPALTPSTKHQTPEEKKPEAAFDGQTAPRQVSRTTTQGVTEPAFIRPPENVAVAGLVALVEDLFRAATGEAFAWDPHPNGPEERALRALHAKHGDNLPALLRAAFEPSFPSYRSLARLARAGAGGLNELRAKAADLRSRAPSASVVGRTTPTRGVCAVCGDDAHAPVWEHPLCVVCWATWDTEAPAARKAGAPLESAEGTAAWVAAKRQEAAA